ncbi:MAG: response regulator [Anaerolineae bacterium]|nr:response regulator [Anaerolineae bacterium]
MNTILVIEDERAIREEVVDILRFEGFEVVEASDGLAGLELARQHHPDLILSDIMMAQMDGYGLLETLQSDPALAVIPFIFLTAKADIRDLRKGMNLGADDYLTKPFTREELLSAVSKRLEKHTLLQTASNQHLDDLRNAIIAHLPHELRTPLIGILGYGSLLEDEPGLLQPEEIAQMGHSIVVSGERLQRLIENYLTYATLQVLAVDPAKTAALSVQVTDFPGQTTTEAAYQAADRHERRADLRLDVTDCAAVMSEDHLHRAVFELVDNAFKFSEAGTPVQVKAALVSGSFTITVQDHGRGMSQDQVERIGAYQQFERALYEQQGSGLGLVIAQQLIELYGGYLTITSAAGEGTIIQAALKVHQPAPEHAAPEAVPV